MPAKTTARRLNYDPSVSPDTQAKAHVADPTKYGSPDETQKRFVGDGATVIPRSYGNVSLGLAHFPNEVNIDPVDPVRGTGGVKVNLADLDPSVMDQALTSATSATEAWDIVRDLQTPKKAARREAPPPPTPAPASVSADILASLGALRPAEVGAPVPITTTAPVPEPPPAPKPIPPDVYVVGGDLNRTNQKIEQLTNVVVELAKMAAASEQAKRAPVKADKEDPGPMQAPLSSLKLDFLGEHDGLKPTIPVFFDLGPGGQFSVKYHHVSVYNGLVVLVYDSRYDGVQFMPPSVDDPIKVKLPSLSQTHTVYSKDCVFSLGVLDICVLVIASSEPDEVDQDERAGRPMLAPRVPRRAPTVPEPEEYAELPEEPVDDEEELPPIL